MATPTLISTSVTRMPVIPDPQVILSPAMALLDEPIQIRVTGLQAAESVTISAQLHDDDGKRWQAQASFRKVVRFGNHQADRREPRASFGVLHQWAEVEIEGGKVGVGMVEDQRDQERAFVQHGESGCVFWSNELGKGLTIYRSNSTRK